MLTFCSLPCLGVRVGGDADGTAHLFADQVLRQIACFLLANAFTIDAICGEGNCLQPSVLDFATAPLANAVIPLFQTFQRRGELGGCRGVDDADPAHPIIARIAERRGNIFGFLGNRPFLIRRECRSVVGRSL